MIDFFFGNETHLWLLITAIVFTFVGRMQMRQNIRFEAASLIGDTVDTTIDRLIEDGYIKTRLDKNGEVELLKYDE